MVSGYPTNGQILRITDRQERQQAARAECCNRCNSSCLDRCGTRGGPPRTAIRRGPGHRWATTAWAPGSSTRIGTGTGSGAAVRGCRCHADHGRQARPRSGSAGRLYGRRRPPPAAWSSPPGTGANEDQLRQIAADGLARMYFRANNSPAHGLGVELTTWSGSRSSSSHPTCGR